MSGSRDRLGLLLPLPALLVAGPESASASVPSEVAASVVAGPSEAAPPAPPPTPDPDSPPSPFEEPDSSEARPGAESDGAIVPMGEESMGQVDEADQLRVRALYEQAVGAFEAGDYARSAERFEEAAGIVPKLVSLWINATVAYRDAALAAQDPKDAWPMCEGARRTMEWVQELEQANEAQRELTQRQVQEAEEHCQILRETFYGPCLSICLSPPPPPRGCRSKRNELAMLGTLMLLGLRTRRRRDAVERMADRLPPDVAAKLRRRANDDAEDAG